MMKKVFSKTLIASALGACLSMPNMMLADDTEIYMNAGLAAGDTDIAQPKVMLILDYRANLGSSFCSSLNDTCRDNLNDGLESGDPLLSNFLLQSDGVTPIPDGTALSELDILRTILRWLFSQLEGFDVGLMINHDADNRCEGFGREDCSNGAYILNGFTDVTSSTLLDKLANVRTPAGGSGAHTFQAKEAYFELYRYLSGGGVYNGHNGYNDYASSTGTLNLDHPDNLDGDGNKTDGVAWDTSIESGGTTYIAPYDDAQNNACSPTYAITLFEGVTNQDADSDDAIETDMADVSGYFTGKTNATALADVVSWMTNEDVNTDVDDDQNVTFYFFSDGPTSNDVTKAVSAAGTPLIDWDSPAQVAKALRDVFRNIAVRSSTLVASSVPVNVFNRSDIQGDVYMAIFEVDEDAGPSWPGNIKKFRIAEITETIINDDGSTTTETGLAVVDVNGNRAISTEDGRVAVGALSYWTDPDLLRDPNPDRADEEPDATKDGRSVTRGGAGHKITGVRDGVDPGDSNSDTGARQIFLEPATIDPFVSGGTALDNLRADYDLGSAADLELLAPLKALMDLPEEDNGDDAALDNLLWLRGYDVEDAGNDYRDWVLADVLHSRPLAINYGSRNTMPGADTSREYNKEVNPDIRIFMGTNDGFMHQFKNTQQGTDAPETTPYVAETGAGDQMGVESWAFMPRELLDNVYTLRRELSEPDVHPYGVDGQATAFVIDNNGDGNIDHRSNEQGACDDTQVLESGFGVRGEHCDKAYIYFGLRRGGKSYYALDVSNPDDPPTILWKIDNTMTGFEELGMTFSTPRTGWVQYTEDGNATPVVMFGGGFYGGWQDTNDDGEIDSRVGKDDLDYVATEESPDPEGAAIYIVHARTGELIWKVTHGDATQSISDTEYNHASMHDSIPSELSPMDSDGNGIFDRIYVGDTAGVVWRIDLPERGASDEEGDHRRNWFATQFASLGSDLRFFHRPDIVQATDSGLDWDIVVMGSGDRAHPKSDTTTNNHFFMLKDSALTSGDADVLDRASFSFSNLENITSTCILGSEEGCNTDNLRDNGWVLNLQAGSAEKNLGSPVVVEGKILFTSYVPGGVSSSDSCGVNIGESLLYVVSLANGSAVFNLSVGNFEGVPDSAEDRYKADVEGIGSDPVAVGPMHVLTPGGDFVEASGVPRWDIYWREMGVDKLN
jgi:type IV pilus assembly protein PilY1